MTKTQHYQLNQWAPEDPVLHADFNRDNALVDAALHTVQQDAARALAEHQTAANARLDQLAAADRTQLLGRYTFPADATQLDIDLSGFDLSQYTALELCFSRMHSSSSYTLRCFVNNVTDSYSTQTTSSNSYMHSAASLASHALDGEHVLCGNWIIRLDGPALFGYYHHHSGTEHLNTILFRFENSDWGLHNRFLKPGDLQSLQVKTTAGIPTGSIYLLGHRF